MTTAWWVYHYAVGVRNEVTVKLYLPPAYATDIGKRGQVANQVKDLPYVRSFHYVSPSAAARMLSPAEQNALKRIPNPLSPAFYVKLTDASQASATAAAAQKISAIHNCGSPPCVTYGKKITDRVLNTLKYILYFVFGLMLLLGIAAVVLIQNTILLEGMMTGMLGAVAAVGLLAGVYLALNGYDRGLTDPARKVGVPLLIAMLAMFGRLLGAFGSGITLRRFLRV